MSETTDLVVDGAHTATGANEAAADGGAASRSRRRASGLAGMLLPELQRLAGELGIPATGRMRKGDLVAAISERQTSPAAPATPGAAAVDAPTAARAPRTPRRAVAPTTVVDAPVADAQVADAPVVEAPVADAPQIAAPRR